MTVNLAMHQRSAARTAMEQQNRVVCTSRSHSTLVFGPIP